MKTWRGGTEETVATVPQNLRRFSPILLGGNEKVVCVRRSGKGELFFVRWGDEEFGPYDDVQDMRIMDSKPLYAARCHHATAKKVWYVFWGQERFGPYEGYCEIVYLTLCGGEPFFVAREAFCTEYVMWGKKAFGPYTEVKNLSADHGTVLYAASCNYRWFVFRNGKRYAGPFAGVDSLQHVEEELLYVAREGNEYSVYQGRERYVGPYEWILNLQVAGGKPLCKVQKGQRHRKEHRGRENIVQWVCWGKRRYGPYRSPHHLLLCSCEQKPLFAVPYRGTLSIIWGGQRIGWYRLPSHFSVRNLAVIGSSPFFIADGESCFAYWGKQRYGPYVGIWGVQSLSGRPLFITHTGGMKSRIVWGNVQSAQYDAILSVAREGERIVFFAMIGKKIVKVSRPFPA